MTLMHNARRRLRRYALFCLMAAGSAAVGFNAPISAADDFRLAAGTHDSAAHASAGPSVCTPVDEGLCGWFEECPESDAVTPPAATHPAELIAAKPARKSAAIASTPTNFLSVSAGETLVINTCNYDTWLQQNVRASSGVIDATPDRDRDVACDGGWYIDEEFESSPKAIRRTTLGFNSTLATLAASASSGNPIPFGHWTEPFAMVGPGGSHLPEKIEMFESWFQQSLDDAQAKCVDQLQAALPVEIVPFVDFDGHVNGDALTVEDESASIALIETTRPALRVHQDIRKRLIGSSPVIVTIEENYFAYDLSEQDLTEVVSAPIETNAPVWTGLTDAPFQPFCVHSFLPPAETNWSPLAKNTESSPEKVDPQPTAPESRTIEQSEAPAEVLSGIVERMIAIYEFAEQMVAYAPEKADEDARRLLRDSVATLQPLANSIQPRSSTETARSVGTSIASLAGKSHRWVDAVSGDLARNMVLAQQPPKQRKQQARRPRPAIQHRAEKTGAGAKLIARADAAPRQQAELTDEKDSAESISAEQLATATALVRQWVDVTRDALEPFRTRLQDVTEVARNRGTQDDSSRR
ncbi:MAG: hypothetical protein AAFV88_18235 [Planctomycetota bacterium]